MNSAGSVALTFRPTVCNAVRAPTDRKKRRVFPIVTTPSRCVIGE
jgi:hypothetical protein